MRAAIPFLVLAAGTTAVAQNTKCNADNCARSVTGTANKPALTSKRADCSSFFQVTVTPEPYVQVVWETVTPFTVAPVTITETITISTKTEVTYITTVTTTSVNLNAPVKREGDLFRRTAVTNSPSHVPSYASWCSGTSRYSSACSCWGVTHVTIQAATPTVVVTSTESATATITPTVTTSDTSTSVVEATSTVTDTCPTSSGFYAKCGSTCKHIRYDPNNCGACGVVCASGTCVNGICGATAENCPVLHNCQGSSQAIYPPCGGRSPSSCLCFQGFDGSRFCTDYTSRSCNTVPLCESHDDCALGNICIINGCCQGGRKYCRPVGAQVCREPNSPTRLFKLRIRGGDDTLPEEALEGVNELGYVSSP